jgi:exodeoxyribonuclease VII small subunit
MKIGTDPKSTSESRKELRMAEQNFEKALAELEEIVAKLEKGGLSLNESLALFEKGVKLARFLREELDKAEKKTEILLKDEKGELQAEPFELSAEEMGENSEEEEKKNDPSQGGEGSGDLPF